MIVLALEFSSPIRSVAVLSREAGSEVSTVLGRASEESHRAASSIRLVELALTQARVEPEAIDCLAIGLGPGSYTGIRSAIALAQGWELARPVRLMGISSADCLAAAAQRRSWFGNIGIVIDAQRDEFYFAGYEVTEGAWKSVEPLRIAAKHTVPSLASTHPILAGPDAAKFFAEGRILFPEASVLGQLTRIGAEWKAGDNLEPIYLREAKFVKAPPPRIMPGS